MTDLKEMSNKELLDNLVRIASYLYRFDVNSEQRKEDVENIYDIRIELLSRLESLKYAKGE